MELINNTTKTLKDDLSVEIKQGSKVSIAAACFSIYAFQELKEQLSQIEQLRFIFTSPTFVTEKAKKERREFYIPRMTRERSLYGTEFEIKLRNELTQKAIARECAEWIRQKVTFKSNTKASNIVISMLPQFQVTMLHSNRCIYVNHIVPSAHYRADHFGTAFRANNSNLIFLVF